MDEKEQEKKEERVKGRERGRGRERERYSEIEGRGTRKGENAIKRNKETLSLKLSLSIICKMLTSSRQARISIMRSR